MIVQGAFNLLFRPGLRKDFRDTYQAWEPVYTQYMRRGNMTMPEISGSQIVGLSRLHERGDGEPITFVYPRMRGKVTGVDKEFAAGFIISRKTVEDDQYGKANQASKWLAHAARMTYEYQNAKLLDDATTGTFFKGLDGLPMVDTAHTLLGSSATVANEPSAPVAFSVTGVNAALNLFRQMKDENGDPMVSTPDTIIISNVQSDYNTALAIWHSALEPFTPNNTDNVIKRQMANPKIVIQPYKADAKSYFFIDSKLFDAWCLVRRAVDFDDDFDFKTDAALYKSTTRFLVWFVDWRGIVGVFPT